MQVPTPPLSRSNSEIRQPLLSQEHLKSQKINMTRLKEHFTLKTENISDKDSSDENFTIVPTNKPVFKFYFKDISEEDLRMKVTCMRRMKNTTERFDYDSELSKLKSIYELRKEGMDQCKGQLEKLQFMKLFEGRNCSVSGLLISGDLTIAGILCDLIMIVYKLCTFDETGIQELLNYAHQLDYVDKKYKTNHTVPPSSTKQSGRTTRAVTAISASVRENLFLKSYSNFCEKYTGNEENIHKLNRKEFNEFWLFELVNSLIDMLSMYPELIRILYNNFNKTSSTSPSTFHIGHIQFIYELSMKYLMLKSLLDVNTARQVIPALDDGQRIAFVTYDFCGAANAAKSGIPTVTSVTINRISTKFILCSREILILLIPFYYEVIELLVYQEDCSKILKEILHLYERHMEDRIQQLHTLVLSPNDLKNKYPGIQLQQFDLTKGSDDCTKLFEILDFVKTNSEYVRMTNYILSLKIDFLIDTNVLLNCSTVMFLYKLSKNVSTGNHTLLLKSEDWRGHDYAKIPKIKIANEYTNKLHLICFFLKQKYPDFYYIEYDINLKYYVLNFLESIKSKSQDEHDTFMKELYDFLYDKNSNSVSSRHQEHDHWFDGFSDEIRDRQTIIHSMTADDYEEKLLNYDIYESCCLALKCMDIGSSQKFGECVVDKFRLFSHNPFITDLTAKVIKNVPITQFTLKNVVHTTDLGHFKLFTESEGEINSNYVDAVVRGSVTEADGSANVENANTQVIEDVNPVELFIADAKIGTIYHSISEIVDPGYESKIVLFEKTRMNGWNNKSGTEITIYSILDIFEKSVQSQLFNEADFQPDFVSCLLMQKNIITAFQFEEQNYSDTDENLKKFRNIQTSILNSLNQIINEISIMFYTKLYTKPKHSVVLEEVPEDIISDIQSFLNYERSQGSANKAGKTLRCVDFLKNKLSIMYRNISTHIDSIHKCIVDTLPVDTLPVDTLPVDTLPVDPLVKLYRFSKSIEEYIINFINYRMTPTLTYAFESAHNSVYTSVYGSVSASSSKHVNGKVGKEKGGNYTKRKIKKNTRKKTTRYYKNVLLHRNVTKNVSKNGLYHKRHRSRMGRQKGPRILHFLKKTRKQKRNLSARLFRKIH